MNSRMKVRSNIIGSPIERLCSRENRNNFKITDSEQLHEIGLKGLTPYGSDGKFTRITRLAQELGYDRKTILVIYLIYD